MIGEKYLYLGEKYLYLGEKYLYLGFLSGTPIIQFPAFLYPVVPAALWPPSLPPFLFRNRRRLSSGKIPP